MKFWKGIRRVVESDGALYFIQDLAERSRTTGRPKQKWHKLCRTSDGEEVFLKALFAMKGTLRGDPSQGNTPERLREWLHLHRSTLASDQARKEYERMVEVLAKALREFDTDEIDAATLLKLLDTKWGQTPTARRAYKARLSTFFNWCVLKRYATTNPCAVLKFKNPPKRTTTATADSYHAVRDAMLIGTDGRPTQMGEVGQCFMDLAYLTSQRLTDVRLVKKTQVAGGMITFRPSKTIHSTAKEVFIPITPAIRAVLDRLESIQAAMNRKRFVPIVTPYLITTRTGKPYSSSGIRSLWRRACERAGVEGLTLKDLRPTAASDAKKAGYTVEQIQQQLAHAELSTTEIYLRDRLPERSAVELALPRKAAKT